MNQSLNPLTEAQPPAPGGGDRRWRFGIRAKLLVAVGTVAAMTLVAGALAWASYSEVERLLAQVTRDNLPSVSAALKLSEATARLAAAAPALDNAQSQFQRQSTFVALQQQSERLRNLIEDLNDIGIGASQLDELRSLMSAIGGNLAGRNGLVERRLQLLERQRSLGAVLAEMDDDIRALQEKRGGGSDTALPLIID